MTEFLSENDGPKYEDPAKMETHVDGIITKAQVHGTAIVNEILVNEYDKGLDLRDIDLQYL